MIPAPRRQRRANLVDEALYVVAVGFATSGSSTRDKSQIRTVSGSHLGLTTPTFLGSTVERRTESKATWIDAAHSSVVCAHCSQQCRAALLFDTSDSSIRRPEASPDELSQDSYRFSYIPVTAHSQEEAVSGIDKNAQRWFSCGVLIARLGSAQSDAMMLRAKQKKSCSMPAP